MFGEHRSACRVFAFFFVWYFFFFGGGDFGLFVFGLDSGPYGLTVAVDVLKGFLFLLRAGPHVFV